MKRTIPARSGFAVALAATALAVAGCGATAGTTKQVNAATGIQNASSTGAGTPKQGGTLTIADYGEPRSLDPTVTYANGATGGSAMAAIYDELMRYDYTTNQFVPELAQSLTSSDNNKTWTLKLRPGVTFTNGQPLNSVAVLGSLKYYETKYAYQTGLLLANVAKTSAPDAQTVVFKLRTSWSEFPDMLAQGPGMIMAPAAYANPTAFKPIGAGPFMFTSYSPGESLILSANPKYFSGRPYLDRLKFVWLGGVDDQPKLDAVTNGTADTAFLLDSQIIAKAQKANMTGMMYGLGMTQNLWINTRAGHPGADPLVRQAINYAFDDASYVSKVSNNTGLATRSLFAPTSPWYSPSSASFDLDKAKQLVAQAKAKGFNGKISYAYSASPAASTGALLLQAYLQNAGFTVTLVPLRSVADQVQTMYVQHSFDIAIAASTLSDVDPYARLAGLFGAQSPTNVSGWSSPQMDSLLAQLEANDEPATGKAIMTQIQQLWDKEVPGISINAGDVFQIWGKNVHGIEPNTETMMLYGKAWKS